MTGSRAVWGIHPLDGTDFAGSGNVLILERHGIGDLRQYGGDRGRIKAVLREHYPDESEGTLGQWTGTLLRFAVLAHAGDLVVHPNPARRTLSLGRLVDDYYWQRSGSVEHHARQVTWLRRGIPRDSLSDAAQKAISGRAAFFSAQGAAPELSALL